jgi:asparagine synthase (glutamine-hydrolysing)
VCGIAGIATTDGLRPGDGVLLERMLASLAHRGPDEQRQVADSRAAIGARRLSIIDLETGSQPLTPEDARILVTQNGEIYNYLELREELIGRGHTFRSQGDTEIIAHLYEDHGDAFVDRLRGMFAVAIWDGRRGRLVLARDRLGKKPLYWRLRDGRLTYGSELKALLCDPDTDRRLDRAALAGYLQYQYVAAPATILQDVHKLPPAGILVWEGGPVSVRTYWRLRYAPKVVRPRDEERAACLAILDEAVRLRLRSDVPVGLFLSGGIDSSTVLALAAAAGNIRTFTVGFEEAQLDERGFARIAAEQFGTSHTEEVVRLDVVSMLPRLADHFDEPFGDSSAIPTFRLAEVAARHVRVVLTGDGGDEGFGGYDRYPLQLRLNRLQALPPVAGRLAAHARRALRRHRAADPDISFEARIGQPADLQYVRMMSMAGLGLRARLMRDDPLADQDAFLLDVLASAPKDSIDRLLATDTLTYLPDDVLVKVDRATMAHSLEARAPLLDHRVMEFAATLPPERKVSGGVMKPLLREVARTLVPAGLVERPKGGFTVPVHAWFRSDLADVYRDLVLGPDALIRDHLDQDVARSMLDAHLAGVRDNGRRLWLLLVFEMWARRWSRAPATAAA